MKRVTGIGGIFFKAKDAPALQAWSLIPRETRSSCGNHLIASKTCNGSFGKSVQR